ncbi:O-antigen translocase [Aeromonas salmonicida]|uniref:O-antigen translocase n=1 Tax=Aeromonas salmonicida TaxID=645 RepID=UPI0028661556|nr:O-antigen translocase [Aeromonas salmonicida]MDR7018914.1 PST family polysaccharide transporter [Aeromonas salmonicida]
MKRLLKVTAMTGLLTLLKMVMGFVIAKVVAVYTGPSGMAMLGQVQSMVGCLNGIINAPVGSGIVRYTAEKKDQGFEACAPWWRAALQWVLIISAVAIPTGLLMANHIADWLFQDESLAWIVMATICVLPLSAIGTLCNSVINGQQLYRRYVGLGMLSALVSAAVMLTMIMLANIQGALFAAAVQAALIGLVMFIANLRQPWFRLQYWWGSSTPEARRSIGGYMLMAITSALTMPISLILVRTILIHQVGWEATGHWQAVWKISEVYLGVITMALGTYYLPRLSSLVGVDAIADEINKTARIIIPVVAAMALCVYLLRDLAIWILFTSDFTAARDLFAIQLCGDVIKIASWLYAYPMLSRGATKWFMSVEVIFSTTFVILTYIFVSYVGIKGATIAYLVNYSICFLIIFLNLKKFAR